MAAYQDINEPIAVEAVFRPCPGPVGSGRIQPNRFWWSGREHKVEQVTYRWQDRRGQARLRFFSVVNGTDVYEICFDSSNCQWTLCRVCCEGG
jgi:hypothetical protein